ncbi:hypothetical protein Mapa_003090 [Marchantia paleacea]|nr:hypothetical protein Mapa_003090 [Marchantia paleacea]
MISQQLAHFTSTFHTTPSHPLCVPHLVRHRKSALMSRTAQDPWFEMGSRTRDWIKEEFDTKQLVLLHGGPGTGKSALARIFYSSQCDAQNSENVFYGAAGGVYMLHCSKTSTILELQLQLLKLVKYTEFDRLKSYLDRANLDEDSTEEITRIVAAHIAALMRKLVGLVIIDEVWNFKILAKIIVKDSRCKYLAITQRPGVVLEGADFKDSEVGVVPVETLGFDQALRVLIDDSDFQPVHEDILNATNYNPMVLRHLNVLAGQLILKGIESRETVWKVVKQNFCMQLADENLRLSARTDVYPYGFAASMRLILSPSSGLEQGHIDLLGVIAMFDGPWVPQVAVEMMWKFVVKDQGKSDFSNIRDSLHALKLIRVEGKSNQKNLSIHHLRQNYILVLAGGESRGIDLMTGIARSTDKVDKTFLLHVCAVYAVSPIRDEARKELWQRAAVHQAPAADFPDFRRFLSSQILEGVEMNDTPSYQNARQMFLSLYERETGTSTSSKFDFWCTHCSLRDGPSKINLILEDRFRSFNSLDEVTMADLDAYDWHLRGLSAYLRSSEFHQAVAREVHRSMKSYKPDFNLINSWKCLLLASVGREEQSKVTRLSLANGDHGGLNLDEAIALCGNLSSNSKVKYLDLEKQGIFGDAIHLARSLNTNTHLVQLNLSSTDMTAEGLQCLMNGLKENTTLRDLDISFNSRIGDVGVGYVASHLKTGGCALKTLQMLEVGCGYQGAESMARALEVNSTLTRFTFGRNRIGRKGFLDLIGVLGRPCCKRLETLVTENQDFDREFSLLSAGTSSLGLVAMELNNLRVIELQGRSVSVGSSRRFNSTLMEMELLHMGAECYFEKAEVSLDGETCLIYFNDNVLFWNLKSADHGVEENINMIKASLTTKLRDLEVRNQILLIIMEALSRKLSISELEERQARQNEDKCSGGELNRDLMIWTAVLACRWILGIAVHAAQRSSPLLLMALAQQDSESAFQLSEDEFYLGSFTLMALAASSEAHHANICTKMFRIFFSFFLFSTICKKGVWALRFPDHTVVLLLLCTHYIVIPWLRKLWQSLSSGSTFERIRGLLAHVSILAIRIHRSGTLFPGMWDLITCV